MSPIVEIFWAHAPAVALKATLVLSLAALVDRILRGRGSAATRHLVWTLGVTASLALPLLAPAVPSLEMRVPAAWPVAAAIAGPLDAPVATDAPSRAGGTASRPVFATAVAAREDASSLDAHAARTRVRDARAPVSPAPSASVGATPAAAPSSWRTILLGAYLLGVAVLLVRMVVELRVVARMTSGARPVSDPEWATLLGHCAARVGVTRGVALVTGGRAGVPLVWGIARPRVLIPAAAANWPEERRRAVLLHELAHVVRHDCLTGLLAAVAGALYWPLPLVWLAAHRLRVERELACDDVVLAGGIARRAYASHLLAIARDGGVFRAPASLAVSMAAPSGLETRMRAALDDTRRRTAPGRGARVLAASLGAVIVLPLAAVRAVAADAGTSHVDGTVTASPARTVVAQPVVLQGGTWYMRRASGAESENGAPSAHVMLNTRGLNTFVVPLARLEGLPDDAFTSGGAARFSLRQDAGTLAFDGAFTTGTGNGRFTFRPDSAFADELVRRGMARPSPSQLFTLGIHGVGLPLLDALAVEGYRQPSTAELVSLSLTGVDAARVRAMASLGYRLGTASALVSLHNQGIDPAFVRRQNASAGRTLSVGELHAARRGARVVVQLDSPRVGTRAVPPSLVVDSIRTRVSPPPEAATASAATSSASGTRPASSTPTEGRWTLVATRGGLQLEVFWSDSTNWRRDITMEELRSLPPSALGGAASTAVAFHTSSDAGRLDFDGTVAHGRGSGAFRFTVNRGFVATLRALGVTDVEDVSDHDLKNLAYAGITAGTVRELQGLGYTRVGWEELLHFAIRLATPQYASTMRAARVQGAETVEGVASLKHLGVSSFTVSEFARSGLTGLSADDLRAMARAGVTPEFVRILRAGGITGLTVDELIARRQGAARR